ncbi:DNA ligase 1 isoform X1 [Acipenser oxyrinchus oxyrinchus]|uniref:DNA ligase n=1 Tax=Acipenser oxyrinchus oxyrinchus TaxID=40147 RepID=A0AAD8FPC3_ACIOX|nr:DNA ligase 1 isoform X1 [Acipenser oxyrinchus oxyrinchus]
MQRSIASFFQPKGGKEKQTVKKDEETTEKKVPLKSPLKPQNGVQECDSPVKRTAKRCRAILDSDDEEPESKDQSDDRNVQGDTPTPQPEKKPDLPKSPPPSMKTDPSSSVDSPVDQSPITEASGTSPSGIPKRRTARKQFPKRKLESTTEGRSQSSEEGESKGSEPKRVRREEAGTAEEVTEEDMEVTSESLPKNNLKNENADVESVHKKGEETDAVKGEGSPRKEEKEATSPEQEVKKEVKVNPEVKSPGVKGKKSPKQEVRKAKSKNSPKQEVKKVKQELEEEVKSPEGNRKLVQSEEEVKAEPPKKKPISSFFAPKKAAAKLEKPGDKPANQLPSPEGGSSTETKPANQLSSPEGGSSKETKPANQLSSPEGGSSKETKPASFFGGSAKTAAAQETSTDYNPSKQKYDPVNDACWSQGQRVPYLAVSRTFERIEEESARLRIIEILSNLFRSIVVLTPSDLLPCLYLCLNQLGPAFLGLELGVGETVLMKAVAQATGRQLDRIKAESQEKGDLGLVAESSRSNQRMMFTPPKLTAVGVFSKLTDIARMTGNASMNKKIDIIKGLFVACRFSEARYIVRSLGGKLRIGLAEQSVLAALAQAVCLTPPGQEFPPTVLDAGKGMSSESRKAWIDEKVLLLKQTYCELPNYDVIVPVLLKEGIDELPKHCKLTPGVPLKPMLAHPTRGIGEVMKRFDEAAFTCEYKYDGERAQIHILENGEIHVYSRNQENNTSKYPDIISRIPEVKKADVVSCIIDAEAVAWDREKRQIQPFQVLTTRKRKDVDASDIKVQVCVYAFDLLYLNGESLVRQPLSRRRSLLKDSFVEKEGEFVFACAIDSDNTDAIAEFLEQSVKDSCEGLMVKTLEKDATYEIAKRSHNWLKLKKDYLDGVGDTLDLAVIGAFLGKGKRAGTYGGFLLACYDDENEEYQSVCKIGTGFKDEDLETHFNFLKDHTLSKPRPYYRVDQSTEPDVWLDAVQVWEVKCADLSLSPVHKAAMGLVDPVKGISLRFPRFLRIRDDKKPEDATNGSQVADLYRKQQQVQNQGSEKADLEDYY